MMALTDHDPQSLSAELARWGCKSVHAKTLMREFFASAGQADLWSLRLGHTLVERLLREMPLRQTSILSCVDSADGTRKLLLSFAGGGAVESVLMPLDHAQRAAGCVSSQIGCAMGCDFCASTRRGLERNLTAGEIIEQFLHLRHQASMLGRRLTTLVFMGMGEPMHNLPAVMEAIRRIRHPQMGAMSGKHITVSTVGVIPGIEALAESGLGVHLALSLHAPDDETRWRIVPMNRRYGVRDIVDAARRYQERVDRIVTIEYCLLEGVNDSDAQAQALADLLAGFRAHVNLIPYNPIGVGVRGTVYRTPVPARTRRFMSLLIDRGVVAHERRARGDDVNAACGQLREVVAEAQSLPWAAGE